MYKFELELGGWSYFVLPFFGAIFFISGLNTFY